MPYLVYSDAPDASLVTSAPQPLRRYTAAVIRRGVGSVWRIHSVLVGSGVVGVAGWTLRSPVAGVVAALGAYTVTGFVLGSYLTWREADRFVPDIEALCQRRVDTLNAFLRSRGVDGAQTVAQYQAGQVQATLADFDRLVTAGVMDRSHRDAVANPGTAAEIAAIAELFDGVGGRGAA